MTLNQVQASGWVAGEEAWGSFFVLCLFFSLFFLFFVFLFLFLVTWNQVLQTRFSVLWFFVLIFLWLETRCRPVVEWQVKRPGAVSCSTGGGGFSIIRTPIGPQLRGRPKPAHTTLKTYFYLPARLTDSQVPPHPHLPHLWQLSAATSPPAAAAGKAWRRRLTDCAASLDFMSLYLSLSLSLYLCRYFVFASVFVLFSVLAIFSLLLWGCLLQPREHEGPKYNQNDPKNWIPLRDIQLN